MQSKNDFRPSLRNRLRSARHTLRKSEVTKKKSVHIAKNRFARQACGRGRKSGAATSRGGENLVSTRPEGGSKIIFALDLYRKRVCKFNGLLQSTDARLNTSLEQRAEELSPFSTLGHQAPGRDAGVGQ